MDRLFAVGFKHHWSCGIWSDVRFLSRSRVRCERVLKNMALVYEYQFCSDHEPVTSHVHDEDEEDTEEDEDEAQDEGEAEYSKEQEREERRFQGKCGEYMIYEVTHAALLGIGTNYFVYLDTLYDEGLVNRHVDPQVTADWPTFAHWVSTDNKEKWQGTSTDRFANAPDFYPLEAMDHVFLRWMALEDRAAASGYAL